MFKVGDRIRCIANWEGYWPLEIGKIYTVSDSGIPGHDTFFIEGHGGKGFNVKRFVLVQNGRYSFIVKNPVNEPQE